MGKKIKKRHIVLGLLALEVVSLPVAAHVVHKSDLKFDKTAFEKPQRAIHVKLNTDPGVTQYMVSANAPFTITSEGIRGTMKVKILEYGLVNGNAIGKNAQLPGPSTACIKTASLAQKAIYISKRGTVARKGDILSKTVLVDIRYDPTLSPEIKVLTQKKSEGILLAAKCGKSASSS